MKGFISLLTLPFLASGAEIDFNRDIRPILSNRCIACHGPDEGDRKADLRLDTDEGLHAINKGIQAVKPGHPDESELIARITTTDKDEIMPPPSKGAPLTPKEIDLLRAWIKQGGKTSLHWSFSPVTRPSLPTVKDPTWAKNPVDLFVLSRLDSLGLTPSPDETPERLIRRMALDLNGIPPTVEFADNFAKHPIDEATKIAADHLLKLPAYGEHMARQWLDIARYADTQGYAEDIPRNIWTWRDWVIKAFNSNMSYDKFTIEQLAGDLLPNPTEDQLIATGFHRNTQTNSEGGTIDEEFRNVAVVDRVNTTYQTWTGITMACAQCHTHKYDPIKHSEYFQSFAIFNQTEDNDLPNDHPLIELRTPEQIQLETNLKNQLVQLNEKLQADTPENRASQEAWESVILSDSGWIKPTIASASGGNATLTPKPDGSILASGPNDATALYTVQLTGVSDFVALRMEALPDASLLNGGPGRVGNFVISHISARWLEPNPQPHARFVRIELPGPQRTLSLAEVEVISNGQNIAPSGTATQIDTAYNGPPALAIDSNSDGDFAKGSVTHTTGGDNPWWELDLGKMTSINSIRIHNRTDANTGNRLQGFRLILLDENHQEIRSLTPLTYPAPAESYDLVTDTVDFASAQADFSQPDFPAETILNPAHASLDGLTPVPGSKGWAISPQTGIRHSLILATREKQITRGRTLEISLYMTSEFAGHNLGNFRFSTHADSGGIINEFLPKPTRDLLAKPPPQRSPEEQSIVRQAWLDFDPELNPLRTEIAAIKDKLKASAPYATAPVMKNLPPTNKRETRIQLRGNYLNLGDAVQPGTPPALGPLPPDFTPDRLGLAKWLTYNKNPLTARVTVNRLWESIFGLGLVRTSDDFGAQGDLPTHPELLDWLASELMDNGWDLQHILRLIVTSHSYRQSSRTTPEALEKDPQNVQLSRGPSLRLTAEQVRDQALFASGLLSPKIGGTPVRPPRPSFGLTTAFASLSTDWVTSEGEDRYRRAIYTEMRRSSPHPSSTTFDATNREVCVVKRSRSNTPMQALVTMNDPVYVEAAQALARRVRFTPDQGTADDKTTLAKAFRLVLIRPPTEEELALLLDLLQSSRATYAAKPQEAKIYATNPIGPLPDNADPAEAAAWTLVAQTILNLDETLTP